jgi:hypothetical protein
VSRGSDREASVERLLRQSLKRQGEAAPRGKCLDAEMLAAGIDGALKGDELKAAEAHLSDCGRCLTMLATIVKTAPEPERRDRWWGSSTLRWLVPLAAGAAAVAIWIAVPSESPRAPEQTVARTEATPSTPAPPPAQEPAAEPRSQVEADESLRARSFDKGLDATPPERTDAPGKPKPTDAREVPKESAPTRQGPAALSDFKAVGRAEGESPTPPPPAPAPDSDRAAAVAGVGERVATAAESTAPPAAAAAPSVATRSAELRRANAASAAAPTEIVSPDAEIRWRAGDRGFVQLSRDRGATWEALRSGVTVDLAAGASPSPSVCWLVGRGGTVLLTTDGRNWARLTFPEAIDLTAVRATDARTATVTTADGRMLTTRDGGLTWTR